MSKKSICFIPAKGYSERLNNKNILPVCGIPLILRSVASAIDSGCFDIVAVSSDSDKILSMSQSAGALALKRDASMATKDFRAKDVVWHHLLELEEEFEYISLLMNTNPFRTAEDIQRANRLIKSNLEKTLISAKRYQFTPFMALDVSSDGRLLNYETLSWQQESSFPQRYHFNGAIFIAKYNYFMEHRTFVSDKTSVYLMSETNSLDIDTAEDYQLANLMCDNLSL